MDLDDLAKHRFRDLYYIYIESMQTKYSLVATKVSRGARVTIVLASVAKLYISLWVQMHPRKKIYH